MLVLLIVWAIFAWVVAVWWQLRSLRREQKDTDPALDEWVPTPGVMGGPGGDGHHHGGHHGGGFGGGFGDHGGHGGHGGR